MSIEMIKFLKGKEPQLKILSARNIDPASMTTFVTRSKAEYWIFSTRIVKNITPEDAAETESLWYMRVNESGTTAEVFEVEKESGKILSGDYIAPGETLPFVSVSYEGEKRLHCIIYNRNKPTRRLRR